MNEMTLEEKNETNSDIIDTSLMSSQDSRTYVFGRQTFKNKMSKSGKRRTKKLEEETKLVM